MSKLTIEIDTSNDAFWNLDCTPTDEVARLLANVGRNYAYNTFNEDHKILDINGNTVGHWRIEP